MYYYVVNPAAGGGRINRIQDELRALLRSLGISGEFVKALGAGDIVRLTEDALEKGATTIVAVGGDATASEMMRTLYGHPGVALGIIPTGQRNHLARLLGIEGWQQAAQVLATRRVERVNLGEADGAYFVGSVGIGFEASPPGLRLLGEHSGLERLRALPSYLGSMRRYRPTEISLTLDGEIRLKAPCINLSISNTRTDSPFSIGLSDPQDRRLDIALISRLSPRSLASGLPDYFAGRLGGVAELSLFRASRVEIHAQNPLPAHLDGETIASLPSEVKIADADLPLVVGRDRRF